MALERGSRSRVNAIEPAAIDTPMLRAGFEGSSEGYERLRNFHPAKVIGNAYDLGSLARAIIEVPSVFLNGAVIGFDGGIGARLYDPVYMTACCNDAAVADSSG